MEEQRKRREAGKERKGEEVTLNHTYLDKNKDERAGYLEMAYMTCSRLCLFVCACMWLIEMFSDPIWSKMSVTNNLTITDLSLV